ncbi:Serine/threonine-protein kinase PLK4 [Sergentomyia squamirostris]
MSINGKMNLGERIEDYRILEPLGKGGFAHVFKALCLNTGIFVAIKMIDKKAMLERNMEARVRQEVIIHSQVKHSSILELYAFFEDDKCVYLVLELARHGELQRFLRSLGRTMSETEAAGVMKQVVAGLLYLHSHKIIHRDLSLSNLLLMDDRHVKIADFGLAIQLVVPDERHVTLCGTPNYMSPEVASRTAHGPPADVWSVGCMLYTLLVGHPPFSTSATTMTLNRVVTSPCQIPEYLSSEAKDLLNRLLEKCPEERIPLEEIPEHPFMRKNHPLASLFHQSVDSGFGNTVESQKSRKILSGPAHFPPEKHFRPPLEATRSAPSESSRMTGFIHSYKANSLEYLAPSTPRGILSNPEVKKWQSSRGKCLTIPRISTKRLQPTRHTTKSAIFHILTTGEVTVETVRQRTLGECVTEVYRISSDGERITLYRPQNGSVPVREEPPEIPPNGPDDIFTYENFPEVHWKKYKHAACFVDLVRVKTPKVTYYSPQAKCQLMETLTDFEALFYNGSSVTRNGETSFRIRSNGTLKTDKTIEDLTESEKWLWEHSEECFKHCLELEKILQRINTGECFPVIVGRRPGNSTVNSPSVSRTPNLSAVSTLSTTQRHPHALRTLQNWSNSQEKDFHADRFQQNSQTRPMRHHYLENSDQTPFSTRPMRLMR